MKLVFFSCTDHISRVQHYMWLVASKLSGIVIGHCCHCRKLYRTRMLYKGLFLIKKTTRIMILFFNDKSKPTRIIVKVYFTANFAWGYNGDLRIINTKAIPSLAIKLLWYTGLIGALQICDLLLESTHDTVVSILYAIVTIESLFPFSFSLGNDFFMYIV